MKETLTGLFCWAGEMNPARDKGVLAILEFAESSPDDDKVHWLSWGGYRLPANWYSYISTKIEVTLINNQVADSPTSYADVSDCTPFAIVPSTSLLQLTQ